MREVWASRQGRGAVRLRGFNQLIGFDRGTVNGTKTGLTGSASRSQDWDHDAPGNWDSVTTDVSAQTRTHNAQNEITSVSGATTASYDANGFFSDGPFSNGFISSGPFSNGLSSNFFLSGGSSPFFASGSRTSNESKNFFTSAWSAL